MSFLEAMKNRYTTKVYDKDLYIHREKIEQLKEILRLSPSSINSQPWKFVFIEDTELKKQLSEKAFYNRPKVENANLLIVFMVKSVDLFEKEMASYLPEPALNYYKLHIKELSKKEKENWMARQVYLSLGILLSACAEMKIDSTTMEGIETAAFDDILNIPDLKHYLLYV